MDLHTSGQIILADLTGKNANVFYELGLAHALAKPAILITESINDVPFDLRSLRVIEYDKNQPDWGSDLQASITKSIREIVDSPLDSVLPTFLSVKPNAKPKGVTAKDKTILEMKRDIDLLRTQLGRRAGEYDVPPIRPVWARSLLSKYLAANMPTSVIERRLVQRGAPIHWVRDQLRQVRRPRGKQKD